MADGDDLKRAAAEHAAQLVHSGMALGLGTGSTATFFVEAVGRLVASGMTLRALATSDHTARLARAAGIEVLEDIQAPLDLAVDGADEIGPGMSLIKGRGGALFREKLVAASARRFMVIADEGKVVPRLGLGVLLPVEVLPFLWGRTAERLADLGGSWQLRGGEDRPYITDNGNLIVDMKFEDGIGDPAALGAAIKAITGVVEHGLFVDLTTGCIVAGVGGIRVLGSID